MDYDYNMGLRWACRAGHLQIVKYMIKLGANDFEEGLLEACHEGHVDIAHKMIKCGANNFNECLLLRSMYRYCDIPRLLYDYGANDFTPLYNIGGETLRLYQLCITNKINPIYDFIDILKKDPWYILVNYLSI